MTVTVFKEGKHEKKPALILGIVLAVFVSCKEELLLFTVSDFNLDIMEYHYYIYTNLFYRTDNVVAVSAGQRLPCRIHY